MMTIVAVSSLLLALCRHTLHLQRNTRDHLNPNLLESTEVSAVPAVMVGTKTSVEETLVAVQGTAPLAQCKSSSYAEFCFGQHRVCFS